MKINSPYPPQPAHSDTMDIPKRYKTNYALLLLVFACIVASFAIGFQFGKSRVPSVQKISTLINKETGKPQGIDFSLFWDAWRIVEDKYVDHEGIDRQKLIYGAIEGMVGSLDDPYSVFFPPEEHKQFENDLKGEFSGIGAEIGIRDDILTIIAPLPDSPAERAGLRAGDKILKINDEPTGDISIEDAVLLIRGEEGTTLRLTIARNGSTDVQDINIVRSSIVVPPLLVEQKSSPGHENDVTYIRILQFNEQAAADFRDEVQNILSSDRRRIILDLRNNPGGYLDVAVDIGGWFLPNGETIVIEVSGDGKKKEYRSDKQGQLEHYPVAILINGGSASASEILAGALKDNRGVPLIGEKTFGKGSVQQLEQMQNETALKITIAKWLTPSGHSINNDGLEPTVALELSEEDYSSGNDSQLFKALEVVGSME